MSSALSRLERRAGIAAAAFSLLAACTDLSLTLADAPTLAAGAYCTNNSDIYKIPIKIAILIDCSESMAGGTVNGVTIPGNDPGPVYARATATQALINHFASDPNVTFDIITFATSAQPDTGGIFTSNPTTLSAAVAAIGVLHGMSGLTDYEAALAQAQIDVVNDEAQVLAQINAALQANPNDPNVKYMRPYYFVVFLSDGLPLTWNAASGSLMQQPESDILFRVQQLVNTGSTYPGMGLTLHTGFLWNFAQNGNDPSIPQAEVLLQDMANAGGGSYTSFATGQVIDFSVFNFTVVRSYQMSFFYVYNRNVVMTPKGPMADSDGDGLADEDELKVYHTDPTNPDTDGDGCSDGFEVKVGAGKLDPLKVDCPCPAEQRVDSDSDGLLDCEEAFIATDPHKFDTDGDGLTDWLEVQFGTNPKDSNDFQEDPDFDGVISMTEIFTGMSPIHYESPEIRQLYAYRYGPMNPSTPMGASQTCYPFHVDNVALANTMAIPGGHAAGINEVVVETIESPKDDPNHEFMLRRLVVQVPYGKGLTKSISTNATVFDTVSTYQTPQTTQ
jgi:hypothetical protein